MNKKIKLIFCARSLILSRVFFGLVFFTALSFADLSNKVIRIGALAKCGRKTCLRLWSPTAVYLSNKIKNHNFVITPLDFDELLSAVEKNKIDFILANPAYYVILEQNYNCQRIATLRNLTPNGVYSYFAGVIFTKADSGIKKLSDLKNKSFMGVHKYSFGGWLMALREFEKAGLNPYKDFSKILFGKTHVNVVKAVLDGNVEAGTVRSGILEEFSRKNNIDISNFHILNQQKDICTFKLSHSTPDYPEWPIAKLKNTPDDLAKKVAIALLEMKSNDLACIAAHCAGWTIPHNYQSVHSCLKEIGANPYENYGKVKVLDIIQQYWLWILGLSVVVSVFFINLNLRLRRVVTSIKNEIRQRNIIENELKNSEQRNSALLKAIPDLIFVLDHNGVFLDFNAQNYNDLLLPPDDFIGKNIAEIMPKEVADIAIDKINKTLQTGEMQSFDYTISLNDGKKYFEGRYAVFGKNQVIALIRDISKRKSSEQILRDSEKKERLFRKKLTALNEITASLSKCGDENDLWKQARNFGKNTLGFDSLNIILFSNENQDVSRNKSNSFPLIVDDNSIGFISIDISYSLSENDCEVLALYAKLLGHLCARIRNEAKNLTLERQIQHSQKLESLGVLAGGIAHDFNNILMGVIGYADLALRNLSPASPARHDILEINKSARRAADLAKQMLAYSGKGKFLIQQIDLNKLIDEINHILEVSISKKAVLKYNFAHNLPGFKGDATQIRQVIMNLITNASEAMENKSGFISVSTSALKFENKKISDLRGYIPQLENQNTILNGLYVCMEVTDTGCGMNEKTKSKIFDPFFTTKFTGRGLGMAAVLGIVRGHNGVITINSTPNKGTSFKIMFPGNFINNAAQTQKNITDNNSQWRGKGAILVADDEKTICAIAKYMLEHIGFQVLVAHNGSDAVEVFKKNADKISCVLLDLTMPRLSGEEVFQKIIEIKPDIKVIVSSGYDEQDAMQNFSNTNVAGFIQKPYAFETLLNLLKKIL